MSLFHPLDATRMRFEDERGYLDVLYESATTVLKRSFSRRGVFRGLHVQRGAATQTKIVRVVSGRILDAVARVQDGRGTIEPRELGPDDGWVKIDAELAHGFYALEDSVFEYICDGRYEETAEESWSITEYLTGVLHLPAPLLSAKDAAAPQLDVISR